MDIKILVAAHKEFPMPADKDLYLPVLVGATKNYRSGINYQRDDEGENISLKNPNYNELTAIYWAWKNLDADAIGLVHYRRLFGSGKRDLRNVLKRKDVEKLLNKADVILPKKRRYYIETIYSHYIHSHHEEPLKETRKVIEEKYPNYLESFDKVMNKRSAHMFNMFIMKKDRFNEYASWIFDVLSELSKRINIDDYSIQEARVYGYIAELLMDVWIEATDTYFVEQSYFQVGKKHMAKKLFFFLKRKFHSSSTDATHF
ncbi:DUF4422 domain-containing protein [Pediococcus acidilactici]|uniref:DUF4422 domain-containing protein n=1 Tax=Pediococcus acidilactici TaxID=1254 RepID=UPI001330C903|nr:DUF4422 domain-containing protein [Pediococcus acidilactici]KAF0488642.1 DUF4422 domain-containing protein [Pediococcus acidilactici]